jgi:hypothetical protein
MVNSGRWRRAVHAVVLPNDNERSADLWPLKFFNALQQVLDSVASYNAFVRDVERKSSRSTGKADEVEPHRKG